MSITYVPLNGDEKDKLSSLPRSELTTKIEALNNLDESLENPNTGLPLFYRLHGSKTTDTEQKLLETRNAIRYDIHELKIKRGDDIGKFTRLVPSTSIGAFGGKKRHKTNKRAMKKRRRTLRR